ncbi:MAG: hypothetical protein R2776_04795 [Flavobacteriaceae bacterium]|nr:hypothetical protein [Flavobacteriaceae bacterium]
MFVGHYAAAFALKGKEPKASLGMLFIATQFVDILFFPFALLGIEHLELVPNFTEVNNFKMDFPFTHGLVASVVWGLLFYLVYNYGIARKKEHRKSISVVMGIAVLSHWFIDLIVHVPDLPILYGEPKLGFGLWNYKDWAFIVEALVLLFGWMYYMRKTQTKKPWGKYVAILFIAFLLFVNYINFYIAPAPPDDIAMITLSSLFAFSLLALLAYLMDKGRTAKT